MIDRLSTRAATAVAVTFLAACAGSPPPPDWQTNAHGALSGFSASYLRGDDQVADHEFRQARRELARTGRGDLIARAELTRCALQVASLQFDDCPGFAALAAEATPNETAYAEFLAGRPVAPTRLPAQYGTLAADATTPAAIDPPLPRLIAAGVLLRRGQLSPAGVDLAVDTASAQGWRRPLLAWLGAQAKLADARGDRERAAQARRRMALVTDER